MLQKQILKDLSIKDIQVSIFFSDTTPYILLSLKTSKRFQNE